MKITCQKTRKTKTKNLKKIKKEQKNKTRKEQKQKTREQETDYKNTIHKEARNNKKVN
jgi:hypothetical protein